MLCSGTDMLTFELGEEKQKFIVHKSYVCHYSPALSAMFNGVWLEAAAGAVKWPEFSPNMFNIFVTWLYNQNLRGALDGYSCDESLCELWGFADRYLIPTLKDDILTLFIHLLRFESALVSSPYEKIPEGSYLRHSLCDILRAAISLTRTRISWFLDGTNRHHFCDAFMGMTGSVPLDKWESIVCPLTCDFDFASGLWESWTTYYFPDNSRAYCPTENIDDWIDRTWLPPRHPSRSQIWVSKEQLRIVCIKPELKRSLGFYKRGLIPRAKFLQFCQKIQDSHTNHIGLSSLEEKLLNKDLLTKSPKNRTQFVETRPISLSRDDNSSETGGSEKCGALSRFGDSEDENELDESKQGYSRWTTRKCLFMVRSHFTSARMMRIVEQQRRDRMGK